MEICAFNMFGSCIFIAQTNNCKIKSKQKPRQRQRLLRYSAVRVRWLFVCRVAIRTWPHLNLMSHYSYISDSTLLWVSHFFYSIASVFAGFRKWFAMISFGCEGFVLAMSVFVCGCFIMFTLAIISLNLSTIWIFVQFIRLVGWWVVLSEWWNIHTLENDKETNTLNNAIQTHWISKVSCTALYYTRIHAKWLSNM